MNRVPRTEEPDRETTNGERELSRERAAGGASITPEEKFLFDLHGYLVIKNVLSTR